MNLFARAPGRHRQRPLPIMTAALEAAGLPADIAPIHPKMAGLVKAAAEGAAESLEQLP
jgi:hypothetical protein